MKTTTHNREKGSTLITTLLMMGLASLAAGSILTATMNYSRVCQRNYSYHQAAFFADAGLHAAMVNLNHNDFSGSDGNISYNQSRTYFNQTSHFKANDWGFTTTFDGVRQVRSTGRYNGIEVLVQSELELGWGHRSIHALYAHALFAGNSSGATNYWLQIGGSSTGADFVRGDTYSGGNIELTGTAHLRLPELLNDLDGNRLCTTNETWGESYITQTFGAPITQAELDAYLASISPYAKHYYGDGEYNFGEAFVDTIGGNGVYDIGEMYTDTNGNGIRDAGDSYIDQNGNGVYDAGVDTVVDTGNGQYDAGEEWVEDNNSTRRNYRQNGRWDAAGGYWQNGVWKTQYYSGGRWRSCASWPAESYEDVGDGYYTVPEPFTDRGNGVYDFGEPFADDRNGIYDYGTQATGNITGMPSPGTGQASATGSDLTIDPPDLQRMYYHLPRTGSQPGDALSRWGHDVAVTASDYGTAKAITDLNRPEHIFVRNPPTSGSSGSVNGRSYTAIYDNTGARIDDYFLEDPADSSYNSSPAPAICANDNVQKSDGTWYNNVTDSMYINVRTNHNNLLYYVDGNLYIHHPSAFSMRFRNPGTRITIVAKGNITISDEFYYNANYPTGTNQIQYANFDSTKVPDPTDALCLIALKNTACTNSGNIYIGDRQFGTGGSIHAMLYAENDFVDNNLNTTAQPYISVFGNMTAGNHVRINRLSGSGYTRTRLDISLDERIRKGRIMVPGLPHPVGTQRSIIVDTAWHRVANSWRSWSRLQ